jgi:hypothetical protein
MRNEIENRLHRVMIKLDKDGVACPYSVKCLTAENCSRCNEYYHKCAIFVDFISKI